MEWIVRCNNCGYAVKPDEAKGRSGVVLCKMQRFDKLTLTTVLSAQK